MIFWSCTRCVMFEGKCEKGQLRIFHIFSASLLLNWLLSGAGEKGLSRRESMSRTKPIRNFLSQSQDDGNDDDVGARQQNNNEQRTGGERSRSLIMSCPKDASWVWATINYRRLNFSLSHHKFSSDSFSSSYQIIKMGEARKTAPHATPCSAH